MVKAVPNKAYDQTVTILINKLTDNQRDLLKKSSWFLGQLFNLQITFQHKLETAMPSFFAYLNHRAMNITVNAIFAGMYMLKAIGKVYSRK